jgi:spermidine/putrescine transport system permease protein
MLAPVTCWLALFTVVPLGFLILMSFWSSNIFGITTDVTLDNYTRFFEEPIYVTVLLKTLRVALLSTVISLIISYPLAWFMATRTGRGKAIVVLLVFLPFWTSYLIRTFAWLPILGRNGLINQALMAMGMTSPIEWFLFNEGTLYLGLVYVYTLFMTLPIFLSLEKLDRNLIDAAADLGATGPQIFRRVVLPLSMPGVVSGSVMVFLLSCGAFVTPQLLGGASAIMFGNLIAGQFLSDNNWAFGAALSVVLMIVVLTFVLLAGRFVGLRRIFMGGHA